MKERLTIDTFADFLCVRSELPGFMSPVVVVLFWPIIPYRTHHAVYVGRTVTGDVGCAYALQDEFARRRFELVDGCATKPLATAEIKLKQPRGKIVEYRNGHFVRITATKRQVVVVSWEFDDKVKLTARRNEQYIQELKDRFAK